MCVFIDCFKDDGDDLHLAKAIPLFLLPPLGNSLSLYVRTYTQCAAAAATHFIQRYNSWVGLAEWLAVAILPLLSSALLLARQKLGPDVC